MTVYCPVHGVPLLRSTETLQNLGSPEWVMYVCPVGAEIGHAAQVRLEDTTVQVWAVIGTQTKEEGL